MKKLSATDAARHFSDVLDAVESGGESFVVVRHGRAVARIGPAAAGTGLALRETLREHRPDPNWAAELREHRPGPNWAAELRELRASVGPPSDPWRD